MSKTACLYIFPTFFSVTSPLQTSATTPLKKREGSRTAPVWHIHHPYLISRCMTVRGYAAIKRTSQENSAS